MCHPSDNVVSNHGVSCAHVYNAACPCTNPHDHDISSEFAISTQQGIYLEPAVPLEEYTVIIGVSSLVYSNLAVVDIWLKCRLLQQCFSHREAG